MKMLKDPTMVIDLYYCGSLERPHRIKEILKNGFSQDGRSTQLKLRLALTPDFFQISYFFFHFFYIMFHYIP